MPICRRRSRQSNTADAIARRKAIYEELHPETVAGVAGAIASNEAQGVTATRNLRTAAFTTSTSEATGKSRSTVERAAARGEALGGSLKDIAAFACLAGIPVSETKGAP